MIHMFLVLALHRPVRLRALDMMAWHGLQHFTIEQENTNIKQEQELARYYVIILR